MRGPAEGGLLPPHRLMPQCSGPTVQVSPADTVSVSYAGSTLWTTIPDARIVGSHAFCAMPYGLLILDVSNPATPSVLSSLYMPGYAFGLAVEGDYAYVAEGGSGLVIVNVANPAAPCWRGATTRRASLMAWRSPATTPTWRMAAPACR